jgi:hypothetical protein
VIKYVLRVMVTCVTLISSDMAHRFQSILLIRLLWPLLAIVAGSCSGAEKEPNNLLDPPFNPAAGELIDDNIAGNQAIQYQKEYKGNNHAVYVSNKAIEKLQNVAGPTCVGVRMYRSVNEEGRIGLIIVGVDINGNDLVDQIGTSPSGSQRVIATYEKCPDNCDNQASKLDSHPNKP